MRGPGVVKGETVRVLYRNGYGSNRAVFVQTSRLLEFATLSQDRP